MRNFKSIVGILGLVLVLPVLLLTNGHVVRFFSQATVIPARIVVDVSKSQAELKGSWRGLSQGGETESDGAIVSLSPVNRQIRSLNPKYIRIDHVLERPYQSRVQEIVDARAVPFISLSYFPPDVASSDIGTVHNYQVWKEKVRNLIETVSGKERMNISGVYYEVWNEPDGEGFGGFNIGTGKDYFLLYKNTVEAALSAKNVNDFKIGGPALADLRRCTDGLLFVCQKYWLDQFFNLVASSKTRMDFISWHRYSKKISDFNEDVNFIINLYTKYSSLPPAEKIITEWGSVPARDPIHNTIFDSAHLVAASKAFLGHVDLATKFEIRDGPSSQNEGWGILYYNGERKPTFEAIQLLSRLRSQRVLLSGEGSHVTGIASRDNGGVTIILVNYDQAGVHTESVPVRFINLHPGRYRLTRSVINRLWPLGHEDITSVTLPKGVFVAQETFLPNSIISYDLKLIGLLDSP